MKTVAAIAVAGLIAGAGAFWILSNPTVVIATVKPLQPSASIPTFKPVPNGLEENKRRARLCQDHKEQCAR